jgi:hypothetical protein
MSATSDEIADESNGRRMGSDEVNAIIPVCVAVLPRVGGMKRSES